MVADSFKAKVPQAIPDSLYIRLELMANLPIAPYINICPMVISQIPL